jgi:hypothetical protein
VQKCFRVSTTADGCTPTTVQVFYNDEHALTLGIRQVQVKQSCAGGTTGVFTTDYPVSPMTPPGNPQCVTSPFVGSQIQDGDQAGTDTAGRPMFPALFITDVTYNPPPPLDLAGDWQYGGRAYPPSFVAGTWKAAVRIVDKTNNTVTVTPDADPPQNNWNLGMCGADPLCSPTPQNEGYGAEIRWNIADLGLEPGHRYRLYFMEHDGDQNKVGGDSGQGCAFITMPGGPPPPQSPTPTASPTPTPTPTATATPAGVVVGGKLLGPSGATKTVVVTFQNNTGMSQVLTALSFNWPQNPNGNLTKIQMGGSTIFNTSTSGGSVTIPSFPSNTTTARTIGIGQCGTMTFTFQSNVSTNPLLYPPSSATFAPFGPVSF